MLATLRAELGQPSVLLAMYDQAGTLQMGLALGLLGDPFLPLPKHINLTDGRWEDGDGVGSRGTPGGCSELDPPPYSSLFQVAPVGAERGWGSRDLGL